MITIKDVMELRIKWKNIKTFQDFKEFGTEAKEKLSPLSDKQILVLMRCENVETILDAIIKAGGE